MPDLDATRANECEMLGPRFRLHIADKSRNAVEAPGGNFLRSRQAKPDAVDMHRYPARHVLQRPPLRPAGVEVIVGDQFEYVDAIERIENSRSELGTPAETDAIPRHPPPQPPHPPPPPQLPPPLPPLPQPLPHPEPLREARSCCSMLCANGDA